MKNVRIIPPRPKDNKKLRVAAYCRFSTSGPEQLRSLEILVITLFINLFLLMFTDEDANETQETITPAETTFHVNLIRKSYTDMIAKYDFNAEQVEMLDELMQEK